MSRSSSSPVASKSAHAPSYYPYIIYSSEEEPFDDLESEYEELRAQHEQPGALKDAAADSSVAGPEDYYKTFMASKPKEFYGTEGAVGLLSWFESVKSKLSITKCAEGNKVEYTACLLQDRALT
ncbi:hypothetical protein Tco_0732021 [Tanacetum coccineum]